MTKETLLMQYQSECLSALKSMANIHKPFSKTFMDTMKLFMAIPDRINFLQLGRYGCFSEQTYRNLFEQTSESWIFTSMRRLQPSTWPKRYVRGSELSIPYPRARLSYTMLICLIFCVFGINPDLQVIDKLFKELILFTARAA